MCTRKSDFYDVHTHQYCGLGVSFCAKAATLVAEEIEFLGGKAILENIFARPGTLASFEIHVSQTFLFDGCCFFGI